MEMLRCESVGIGALTFLHATHHIYDCFEGDLVWGTFAGRSMIIVVLLVLSKESLIHFFHLLFIVWFRIFHEAIFEFVCNWLFWRAAIDNRCRFVSAIAVKWLPCLPKVIRIAKFQVCVKAILRLLLRLSLGLPNCAFVSGSDAKTFKKGRAVAWTPFCNPYIMYVNWLFL